MTLTLAQYCEKHNLTLIEEYRTLGEKHSHTRALVIYNETGEKQRLYYDYSRRRKSHKQDKEDYQIYMNGGVPPFPRARGWRNTTLDNRRRRKKHE